MLGFCILCILRSNEYPRVVPGEQPMSSHLVMLANSRFVSVLLHNSNGAVVSSHNMQSVLDSHSLPLTIATCAGSFHLGSQTFMLKSCPLRSERSRVEEGDQTYVCASPENACNEDLMETRV
jgi:hypothetical protein